MTLKKAGREPPLKCECGNTEWEVEYAEHIIDHPSNIERMPMMPWRCSKCGKDAPPNDMLPNWKKLYDEANTRPE